MYFHSHKSYLLPESVSIFPLKKSYLSKFDYLKIIQRCLKILFKHPPNLIQTISVGALHQNVQQHQTRGHLATPSNPHSNLQPRASPFQLIMNFQLASVGSGEPAIRIQPGAKLPKLRKSGPQAT